MRMGAFGWWFDRRLGPCIHWQLSSREEERTRKRRHTREDGGKTEMGILLPQAVECLEPAQARGQAGKLLEMVGLWTYTRMHFCCLELSLFRHFVIQSQAMNSLWVWHLTQVSPVPVVLNSQGRVDFPLLCTHGLSWSCHSTCTCRHDYPLMC